MITFGYKSRLTGPLKALAALIVGIVMVVNPDTAFASVVKLIAVFLLASGLVSLFVGLKDKENSALPLMMFNAAVNISIGLLLFIFPGFVASFIIYLIGFALLVFGIMQLVTLFSARGVVAMGVFPYVLPALVTMLGAFKLFNPFAESVMSTMAGVALIVYGASELLSSWKMKQAVDEYEIHMEQEHKQQTVSEDMSGVDVKDVDYEKVDEQ